MRHRPRRGPRRSVLSIVKLDGSEELTRDAYQYGPIMGDVDLHLFAEGQHWKIYEKFGVKMMSALTPVQIEKLKTNPDLYTRLTSYTENK